MSIESYIFGCYILVRLAVMTCYNTSNCLPRLHVGSHNQQVVWLLTEIERV